MDHKSLREVRLGWDAFAREVQEEIYLFKLPHMPKIKPTPVRTF
jgi:hypothetical protein